MKKILWVAYCCDCNEALESCPNGNFAEAAARIHLRKDSTNLHKVIVGYQVETKESELAET